MAHKFVIRKSANGEYRASFDYGGDKVFFTEGYSSKAGAKNAIDSIKSNGPGAPVDDQTD